MDQLLSIRHAEAGPAFRRLKRCLGGRKLRQTRRELGGEESEFGIEMNAQILDGLFEAVVGGDLLSLAYLHSFEVGQDYLGQKRREGSVGLVHEEILSRNPPGRMITTNRELVTGFW